VCRRVGRCHSVSDAPHAQSLGVQPVHRAGMPRLVRCGGKGGSRSPCVRCCSCRSGAGDRWLVALLLLLLLIIIIIITLSLSPPSSTHPLRCGHLALDSTVIMTKCVLRVVSCRQDKGQKVGPCCDGGNGRTLFRGWSVDCSQPFDELRDGEQGAEPHYCAVVVATTTILIISTAQTAIASPRQCHRFSRRFSSPHSTLPAPLSF
jgi:hypothetical protein